LAITYTLANGPTNDCVVTEKPRVAYAWFVCDSLMYFAC